MSVHTSCARYNAGNLNSLQYMLLIKREQIIISKNSARILFCPTSPKVIKLVTTENRTSTNPHMGAARTMLCSVRALWTLTLSPLNYRKYRGFLYAHIHTYMSTLFVLFSFKNVTCWRRNMPTHLHAFLAHLQNILGHNLNMSPTKSQSVTS